MKGLSIFFYFLVGISSASAQSFEWYKTYTTEGAGLVRSLSFDKSGKYILRAGRTTYDIEIWETETGNLHKSFPEKMPVYGASYSLDEKNVVALRQNNTLRIWQENNNGLEISYNRAANIYRHLAYHPNENKVLLVSQYQMVVVDVPTGKVIQTLPTKEAQERMTVVDTQTGKVNQTLSKSVVGNLFTKAVYSPDGKYIAVAGTSVVSVFDVNTGEQSVLDGHVGQVLDIAYSPNGKEIAITSIDGAVKIWNVDSKKNAKIILPKEDLARLLCYSPDGKHLAVATQNNALQIWDLTTEDKHFTFTDLKSKITALAYSPDRKYLALGFENGVMQVWKDARYLFQHECEFYVQQKLEKWYEKNKFEKTAEFQARLQQNKIEEKVKEWTQEWINETSNKRVNWKKITYDYDADNETYRIKIDYLEPVFVKIPIEDAKLIDKQLDKLKYRKVEFGLTEAGEVSILSLKLEALLQNATTGNLEVKQYYYNSQQKPAFEASSLKLKYPEMPKIEIPVLPTPKEPEKTTEKAIIAQNAQAEVDTNLPKTKNSNPNAIAVIIGNATYQKVKEVKYALHDAQVMKKYVVEVLGFKEENVLYYENAKYTDFKVIFGEASNPKGKLYNMIKPQESDVFVFYSGHGAPSLNNKKGYFVPVDCDPQYIELAAYPIDVFYENLANMRAKSLTIAVDACFSGADIFQNISPIVIKPKGVAGVKEGALFSSSTDLQVSCWYPEKGHGMFTYFFLKAIHNKNADKNKDNKLTLKEIHEYMADQSEGLPYYARRIHAIEQTPTLQGQMLERVLVEY